MKRPGWHELWYDERDKPSFARGALTYCLLFTSLVTIALLFGAGTERTGEAILDYWLPIVLGFIGWSGGTKVLTALGPAIVAAAGKVRGMAGEWWSRSSAEGGTSTPDAREPDQPGE